MSWQAYPLHHTEGKPRSEPGLLPGVRALGFSALFAGWEVTRKVVERGRRRVDPYPEEITSRSTLFALATLSCLLLGLSSPLLHALVLLL